MRGCQGNCQTAAFISLTSFLNSKSLTYHFPPYKKAGSKGNLRRSVRVRNMWSSQITSHLSKVPIKIQSLSLLIGSSSVRQHNFSSFSFTGKKIEGEYVLNSLICRCVLSVILACCGCKITVKSHLWVQGAQKTELNPSSYTNGR